MVRDPRGHTDVNFDVPGQLANIPDLGMFWVDEKTLEQNFEVISVCKVKKGYQYFYKTFDKKELPNNRGGLLLNVGKPTKAFVTIYQKHKKFFDDKFSYDVLRILIAEVSTNKNSFNVVKTLSSDFKPMQACHLEVDL